MNREDILIKAACKKAGEFAKCPSRGNSGLENHYGKEYVVLRNTSDLLSVWLVEIGEELSLVEPTDYPDELAAELSEQL